MAFEAMRVKYMFMDLRYPTYLKLQISLVVVGAVLAAVLFPYRGDANWLLGNGWWLCLVAVVGEVLESVVAISVAKKKYRGQGPEG